MIKGKLSNERTKPVRRTSRDYMLCVMETEHGKVELTVWDDGRVYLDLHDNEGIYWREAYRDLSKRLPEDEG